MTETSRNNTMVVKSIYPELLAFPPNKSFTTPIWPRDLMHLLAHPLDPTSTVAGCQEFYGHRVLARETA